MNYVITFFSLIMLNWSFQTSQRIKKVYKHPLEVWLLWRNEVKHIN